MADVAVVALALGHPDQSPFVKVTRGKKIRIRFDRKVRLRTALATRVNN
jgi:hypothetical protein